MENKIIKSFSRFILERHEYPEYVGIHTSPSTDDSPLYDLVNAYGDDIYSSNALRYFGSGYPSFVSVDADSIRIMQRVHNKPDAIVTIYRSVPDPNKDIDRQIRKLRKIIDFKNKYRFYPIKDSIIDELRDKYDDLEWDDMMVKIEEELYSMINDLNKQKQKPLKINNGDWITLTKQYAKEHGDSHLGNYKIVSKNVKAKTVFSDGNSVQEFGYWEVD